MLQAKVKSSIVKKNNNKKKQRQRAKWFRREFQGDTVVVFYTCEGVRCLLGRTYWFTDQLSAELYFYRHHHIVPQPTVPLVLLLHFNKSETAQCSKNIFTPCVVFSHVKLRSHCFLFFFCKDWSSLNWCCVSTMFCLAIAPSFSCFLFTLPSRMIRFTSILLCFALILADFHPLVQFHHLNLKHQGGEHHYIRTLFIFWFAKIENRSRRVVIRSFVSM